MSWRKKASLDEAVEAISQILVIRLQLLMLPHLKYMIYRLDQESDILRNEFYSHQF